MRTVAVRLAFVVLAASVAGCVAVDSRAKRERPAIDSLARISGRFRNEPTYYSQKGSFSGETDLGEGLGMPSSDTNGNPIVGKHKAETVSLSYSPEQGLHVTLERGGKAVVEQTFALKSDLRVENGTLVLKSGGCGVGLGLGCGSHKKTLFVNDSGDLVVVDSGNFSGLVTLIPFVMHAKLMSIFPRVQ